jgi:hypothetical protein
VSFLNPFSCKIQIFKVRVKVSYFFYETLKMFNDFSRENHGHGGHEHGVRRRVFGVKLLFKKMSAGGRLCTLQENPHFWVPRIKVRTPDGILACAQTAGIRRFILVAVDVGLLANPTVVGACSLGHRSWRGTQAQQVMCCAQDDWQGPKEQCEKVWVAPSCIQALSLD